jgi:hypothetical protein
MTPAHWQIDAPAQLAHTSSMASQINWTRAEVLAALHVYLQLPFGQLHHNQPKIKLAKLGRPEAC